MPATRIEIIERIESLMGTMSQEKFGEIIGCKQSKVSSLLSRAGKKRFTVEELEKIADHFNVSVDSLLGRNEKKKAPGQIAPRDFCEMLVDMVDFQGYSMHLKEITVKEKSGYMCGDEITHTTSENQYLSVYFSEYHGNSDEFVINNLNKDAPVKQVGYFEESAHEINKFLCHWNKIRKAYFEGHIDREYYDILVSKKLSEVADISNERIAIDENAKSWISVE